MEDLLATEVPGAHELYAQLMQTVHCPVIYRAAEASATSKSCSTLWLSM